MSEQGATAHEAALGRGHVTTWIAVRGHIVDEQITALLKHPRSSSTHMHIEHEKLVKDHTIQQQVNFNTYFSAAIHLLMYLAERQLSGMADSSVMHVPMHMPTVTKLHA